MSAVRLRVCAPAKINLHLEVLGLRGDGYHDVRTILQSIALADTLVLTPRRGPFTVRSRAQAMPRDRENLIWRAAAALWRALGRSGDPSGVAVTIRKVVPAGAGLGGASSDAASALRALRRIWAPDAPDRLLRDVAAAVGSDVPFFLQGGTVVATGRGERTRRLAPVDPCEVVIGVPGFEVSTAAAYRWWDEEAGVGAGRRSAGLEAGAPGRGGALGPGRAGLEAGAPVRGGAVGPGHAGLEAGAPVRGGALGPGHAGLEAAHQYGAARGRRTGDGAEGVAVAARAAVERSGGAGVESASGARGDGAAASGHRRSSRGDDGQRVGGVRAVPVRDSGGTGSARGAASGVADDADPNDRCGGPSPARRRCSNPLIRVHSAIAHGARAPERAATVTGAHRRGGIDSAGGPLPLGRGQAVRLRVLVPGSRVRILPPQPFACVAAIGQEPRCQRGARMMCRRIRE